MLHSFWRSTSLRTRLVAITTILTFATVTVTGLLSVLMLRNSLIQRMDSELKDSTQSIIQVLYSGHQNGTNPNNELMRTYGAIIDQDNIILWQTQTSNVSDIPKLTDYSLEDLRSHNSQGFFVRGTSVDSPGWRVIAYDLQGENGKTLIVGQSMAPIEDVSKNSAFLISTIGMVMTLLATLIAYLLVTRAFSPLRKVERTAAKIAAGDLSQRVDVENPSTEVGKLSRSLNAMLAHIESAFFAQAQTEASMRRFVSDASHELRTPLVAIRGYSELYRHGAIHRPEDVSSAMGRIESEAKRMGDLVEDLLTLARADEKRPLDLQPLDLYILAHDAVMDAQVSAPDRSITLVGLESNSGPRAAPVIGDDARLRQIIVNLVTNALRYTPSGSPIELAVGLEEDGLSTPEAVLQVRDHGPGISSGDEEKIFERFFRADASRQRETGGTGLGLAIVAAIASQHGGKVRLSTTEGGGATFTLTLPSTPFDEES